MLQPWTNATATFGAKRSEVWHSQFVTINRDVSQQSKIMTAPALCPSPSSLLLLQRG